MRLLASSTVLFAAVVDRSGHAFRGRKGHSVLHCGGAVVVVVVVVQYTDVSCADWRKIVNSWYNFYLYELSLHNIRHRYNLRCLSTGH